MKSFFDKQYDSPFPAVLCHSTCNFQLLSLFFHHRNEALRVAFIDEVETLKDGKVHTEYFSKLVKADINGKDKVLLCVIFIFFLVYTISV